MAPYQFKSRIRHPHKSVRNVCQFCGGPPVGTVWTQSGGNVLVRAEGRP